MDSAHMCMHVVAASPPACFSQIFPVHLSLDPPLPPRPPPQVTQWCGEQCTCDLSQASVFSQSLGYQVRAVCMLLLAVICKPRVRELPSLGSCHPRYSRCSRLTPFPPTLTRSPEIVWRVTPATVMLHTVTSLITAVTICPLECRHSTSCLVDRTRADVTSSYLVTCCYYLTAPCRHWTSCLADRTRAAPHRQSQPRCVGDSIRLSAVTCSYFYSPLVSAHSRWVAQCPEGVLSSPPCPLKTPPSSPHQVAASLAPSNPLLSSIITNLGTSTGVAGVGGSGDTPILNAVLSTAAGGGSGGSGGAGSPRGGSGGSSPALPPGQAMMAGLANAMGAQAASMGSQAANAMGAQAASLGAQAASAFKGAAVTTAPAFKGGGLGGGGGGGSGGYAEGILTTLSKQAVNSGVIGNVSRLG